MGIPSIDPVLGSEKTSEFIVSYLCKGLNPRSLSDSRRLLYDSCLIDNEDEKVNNLIKRETHKW